MITYERFAFGLNLMFRVHGSATYRSIVPGLVSMLVLYFIRSIQGNHPHLAQDLNVEHPYAFGVVVSGITFLIVFRASQGYSRYWEATSSVYGMMSKWMDATVHAASYHMQATRYDAIKPPSFDQFPELDGLGLTRDRERVRQPLLQRNPSSSSSSTSTTLLHKNKNNKNSSTRNQQQTNVKSLQHRAVAKSINVVQDPAVLNHRKTSGGGTPSSAVLAGNFAPHGSSARGEEERPGLYHPSSHKMGRSSMSTTTGKSDPHLAAPSNSLTGRARLDGNWGALKFSTTRCGGYKSSTATFYDPTTRSIPYHKHGFASCQGGRTPPLFLQELAHLSSLLTAVALATLRNDIAGAESPLDYYEPGSPWPCVDPGDIPELYTSRWEKSWITLLSFLGRGRTPLERTRYNALRPLPVLGGVSEAEIHFLQLARGPYAKTQLCFHWLSEFLTREHLAGSMGKVGPPIISRIIQFLGDGMFQYNQGRKIMSIPFPFVHAQHSAIFVLVMMGVVPFLMDQYCDDYWAGALLTFLSVVCLSGIHEVARELENPFRNVPNELPVVTMMAEFNEALVTMYAGYHPDAYWEPPEEQDDADEDDEDDDDAVHTSQTRQRGASTISRSPGSEVLKAQEDEELDATEEETDPEDMVASTPPAAYSRATARSVASSCSPTVTSAMTSGGSTATIASSETKRATATKEKTSDFNSHDQDKDKQQLNQLRAIVVEQGRVMSQMLEEQARLNKLLQEALLGAGDQEGSDVIVDA